MTSTPTERDHYRSQAFPSFDELAQREVIRLEEITGGSSLPITYVVARGFAALTYAVLALRETADTASTDLTNVLSEVSEHAGDASGGLTDLAASVADAGQTLADASARPDGRRFRLRRLGAS